MKTLSAAITLGVILSTVVSVATPAFALGGCGGNRHRNRYGYCVRGGQRENWCLRRTGYIATRMWNGNLRCF